MGKRQLKDRINNYLLRYDYGVDKILIDFNKNNSFFDSLISESFYPSYKEDRFTINDIINEIEFNPNLKIKDKEKIIAKLSIKVRIFTKNQFGM